MQFRTTKSFNKMFFYDIRSFGLGYFIFNGNDSMDKEFLIKRYDTVNFTNKSNSIRGDIFTNLIYKKEK